MHSQTELTDVVQRGPQTEGRVASCYDETRPPGARPFTCRDVTDLLGSKGREVYTCIRLSMKQEEGYGNGNNVS